MILFSLPLKSEQYMISFGHVLKDSSSVVGREATNLSCERPETRPVCGASGTAGLQTPPPAASLQTTATHTRVCTTV